MRSSKSALSSRRVSSGVRLPLVFSASTAEHIDALARAEDVDLGLLALVGCAAELHDRGHVDGLDELVEAHCGRVIHARVGGANRGVEPVGGHLIGAAGLIVLLCGGRRAGAQAPCASRRRGGRCWRLRAVAAAVGAARWLSEMRSSRSGDGSASGRSSPSMVNLRRSVTTKGLFCSGIVTLFQKIQMRCARRGAAVEKGSETGMAIPPA